jgi:cytidine deaminase
MLDKDKITELFNKAMGIQKNAYAPYSGFQVAASILMDDNQIYTGVNVENASYGGTVCAERIGIFKGISEGAKNIKAVLVLIKANEVWPPCGFCLQVISEFAEEDTPIVLMTTEGKQKEYQLKDLLPVSFKLI